jgi:Uma2 family endonuclease
MADLLHQLGSIPANRVLLHPAPGTATEEDVLALQASENRLCELIDGVLVEKAMATWEARVAAVIVFFLETYMSVHDLGLVLGADGMLRLFPHQVRIPDVSFISWRQLPNREFPRDPIASLYPDLAVEVLSEGNTEAEIARKVRDYFRAGTSLVWVVDPAARTVVVHTSPRRSKLLTEAHSLDGGKVLPGFSLSIGQLFARARGKR